jgi:hypothetical protein
MVHWEIAPQTNKELQSFTIILEYWRWFREMCLRLYGVSGLPETFGEQDGAIHEHRWVDPEEDWTAPPPEYNHDWRTQEIRWVCEGYRVSFTRNEDIYSHYLRFEIKSPIDGEPTTLIKLRLSQFSKGEAVLQDTEDRMAVWEKALRALTES